MKGKKSLIALFVIMVVTVAGTLAYYTSNVGINNTFTVGTFRNRITEVFTSPSNWKPGDVTAKTVTVENTGTVPAKVRVKLVEEWKDSNNNSLPLVDNGQYISIINLTNTSSWTKSGEYYYYNGVLNPNDIAPTFMSSVTFNNNVELGSTICKKINETRTCETTAGYKGKSYKLTVVIDLAQSDAYETIWGITASSITTPTSYVLTFDPNGGTITKFRDVVTNGETYNLPTATKTGYTFDGWYLDSNFTTKITNSDTANLSQDKIVYAKWVEE